MITLFKLTGFEIIKTCYLFSIPKNIELSGWNTMNASYFFFLIDIL